MDNPQAAGDGQTLVASPARAERPEDLTLGNFFSAGWDDEWAKQERATGTPNMALLRVQTNFMEREFRANYYFENNVASTTTKNMTDFDALIAWSFNRRLMLEITGAYQWTDPRTGVRDGRRQSRPGGPSPIDRHRIVVLFLQLQGRRAQSGIGYRQSTISYGVAGFEDLAYWFGLDRVGLYYSFLFDSYTGPVAAGTKLDDVGYDVTLAKTFTDPKTPLLGNLTLLRGELRPNRPGRNACRTDPRTDHAGRPFQPGQGEASRSAKTTGSCSARTFRFRPTIPGTRSTVSRTSRTSRFASQAIR